MTRRVVKYPTPMIASAILTVLVMGGCTTTTAGAPSTTNTRSPAGTTPTSATTKDPLAHTDPCSLLDQAVITANQLQPSKSGTGPGTRYCRWDTGASGVGYNLAVNIYDNAGLDKLSVAGFTVTNYPVGRHQGRMSKDTVGGACAVSIGVTSTSRVDVVGVDYGGQLDRACVVATTVAPAVEQKLPVGGGS
jgi:hypothetical protein